MSHSLSTSPPSPGALEFDVEAVRRDFPGLHQQVNGNPLVYLDNAATAQKPQSVIDAVVNFYTHDCANIHRGVHALSERATARYERARMTVQRFLNAGDKREIVFTRGATEAINLVAHSFVRPSLNAGDQIVITGLEHHSNIVPWQILCDETGAKLVVAPIHDDGTLDLHKLQELLTPKTRLLSVVHVSNAIGTMNPVEELVAAARQRGIPTLIDGAQAAPHCPIDVQSLDCDFYAFSGHKVFGPTGIGVLYGKQNLLEQMPPYQGGGDMIKSVTFEKTIYNDLPFKFEAGTPNIAGTIGLGAALEYLAALDFDAAQAHERQLVEYAVERLRELDGVRLIGTAPRRAGAVSFTLADVHPHDAGTILDQQGVAVRTGHHCAQPLMDRFGVPATIRASIAFYNTKNDVDRLIDALQTVREVFA